MKKTVRAALTILFVLAVVFSLPLTALSSADDLLEIGDISGDGVVTASDARMILRLSARLEPIESFGTAQLNAADFNSDGLITASDARGVLRKAARLSDEIQTAAPETTSAEEQTTPEETTTIAEAQTTREETTVRAREEVTTKTQLPSETTAVDEKQDATTDDATQASALTTASDDTTENTVSDTVYVTPSGKKYHKAGCGHIKNSVVTPIDRDKAIESGYEPCKTCKP